MKAIASVAVLLALLFSSGCRFLSKSSPAVSQRSRAALERLALAPRFVPPADGLLTDAQIDRYLRARRAKAGQPEGQAARLPEMDRGEFAWVQARVDEAILASDARRVRAASEETYARTIASLKRARESVKDADTARTLGDQIAALERERALVKGTESLAPAIASNARRVALRRADFDALGP